MAKKKNKIAYVCGDCGAEHPQWQGQCIACGNWNTLTRISLGYEPAQVSVPQGFSGSEQEVRWLGDVGSEPSQRLNSGFSELDRVLGGGFVPGSVVLIGGDPGAGKSTLLLQTLAEISKAHKVLYVTGEESLHQLALRAKRLRLTTDSVMVAADTQAESVAGLISEQQPKIVVLDSIQVMHMSSVDATPGSVSQVRETAAFFTRIAKQSGVVIVLVGHVTKEGNLAGPKVLEHMIDCFVMLDSPSESKFRTLRGQKNRFGAVNELGVFAMTEYGMKEVSNPSAIFLQRGEVHSPGSIVTVTWEGTRPLLVEIQALVDLVGSGYSKRSALGLDQQRLSMHLAVLHRHCGVILSDQDVFTNAVGGVKIGETAADLAVLLSVVSSYKNRAMPQDLIVFGEIGLTGEIRAVANGQERIAEARKHGFKKAIVPFANLPKQPIKGMEIEGVRNLTAALDSIDLYN